MWLGAIFAIHHGSLPNCHLCSFYMMIPVMTSHQKTGDELKIFPQKERNTPPPPPPIACHDINRDPKWENKRGISE